MVSVYQANKLIFVSAGDSGHLVQSSQDFEVPMGIAVGKDLLNVATRDQIVTLSYSHALASRYPQQSDTCDGQYVPQTRYPCGPLKIHDLAWGTDELWAVNTLFSCLAVTDGQHSLNFRWHPPFISELVPEDRCHLNGIAMLDHRPEFVTALGKTNSSEGWRARKTSGGIVMHVPSGEVVLGDLPMPHTPRIYGNELYLLLSAMGELVRVDVAQGKYEIVTRMRGFVRGMARYDNYVFVGLSQLRRKSPTFSDIPIARDSPFCGIVAIDLAQGTIVGHLKYETTCQEIYDIQALPGLRRPGLIRASEQ